MSLNGGVGRGTLDAGNKLSGATAYVGFNKQYQHFVNYFLCDGVADDVQMNWATTYVSGLGGGSVELECEAYNNVATVNVPAGVTVRGHGNDTVVNYDAGGSCFTVTGDNSKIHDLKVVIVAGAGAGGTRPNCVYAANRVNLECRGLWLVGDETVGDDGSDTRQCGIVFSGVTYSRINFCRSNDHTRHGIFLYSSSDDNTVTGNTCNGNTLYGIYLYSSSNDNTVTGNTCNGNTQYGIYLYSSSDNTVTGNTCNGNDSEDTGTYDGISLSGSTGNLIGSNTCKDNDRWGIMVDADSDYNKVSNNYTDGNTAGSIRVNNANCDSNQIEFNTVEEGAPGDVGTLTRSYGNYDPSANAFVGDVGAAPF